MQGHIAEEQVRWEIVWPLVERAVGRRQSFFPAGLKVERCEIWNSQSHLGTTKRKPVQEASLEESQGMCESQKERDRETQREGI